VSWERKKKGEEKRRWQRRTLPPRDHGSTLRAGRLNDRVRDGDRVYPCRWCHQHRLALASGFLMLAFGVSFASWIQPSRFHARVPISPHHSLTSARPLVPLGSRHCCPSTCGLSNWSSASGLRLSRDRVSHLQVRFPLRCFQRFSAPELATRRCTWRCNRHTSAPSTPVLSY
jgi:hypothetical protein